MWILATAVLTASLLGSMHCVGMCGPLAVWASGAGTSASRSHVTIATTMYHVGRLATYAIAGLIAGAIGGMLDWGGQALGLQLAAARIVGTVMVVVGVVKLWQIARRHFSLWNRAESQATQRQDGAGGIVRPSRIGGVLVKLRPSIFRLPLFQRAFVTGLLTTLLPCGWLYLFALIAAGTGSVVLGPIVMIAFWIGTVPALTGLVVGTVALSRRFTTAVPVGAATVLILAGCYTASGRGFEDLQSLTDIRPGVSFDENSHGEGFGISASDIDELVATPLPCCTHAAVEAKQP